MALKNAMMQGSVDLADPVQIPELTLNTRPCKSNTVFDWGTGCGLVQADLVFDVVGGSANGVFLSIASNKPQIRAGDTLNYQFKLFNQSNQRLENARVRALRLPDYVIYEAINGCNAINSVEISCQLGTLGPKQTATFSIQVKALNNPSKKLSF